MLISPRYSGLELAVYEAEDVQLTDVRQISAAQPGETFTDHSVLRSVQMQLGCGTPAPDNLEDFLAITDSELYKAAGLCKADVVGHQWGLVHDPEGVHYSGAEQFSLCGNGCMPGLMPKGHFLVAEVDMIDDVINIQPRSAPRILAGHALDALAVGLGVKLYRLTPHTKGYRLWDLLPSQFVIGSSRAAEEAEDKRPRTWYVDIEPRLIAD